MPVGRDFSAMSRFVRPKQLAVAVVSIVAICILLLFLILRGDDLGPLESRTTNASATSPVRGEAEATAPSASRREVTRESRPQSAPSVQSQPTILSQKQVQLLIRVESTAGEPVTGARVKVDPASNDPGLWYQAKMQNCISDLTGVACVDVWPSGRSFLVTVEQIEANHFIPTRFFPPPDAEKFECTIRAKAVGSIRGKLVDSEGRPVRGSAVVRPSPMKRPVAIYPFDKATDADGSFEFTGLTPGGWRAVVAGVNLGLSSMETEVIAGRTTDLGKITLPERVYLEGEVVNESGAPIAGIDVGSGAGIYQKISEPGGLPGCRELTDERGHFKIACQGPAGLDTINVGVFKNAGESGVASGSRTIPRSFGPFRGPQRSLRLVMDRGCDVAVRLNHSLLGKTISSAQVWIESATFNSGYLGVTNPQGYFEFFNVPAGRHRVVAWSMLMSNDPDSFGLTSKEIEIHPGNAKVEIDLATEPAFQVDLRFLDTENRPISTLEVRCEFSTGETQPKQTLVRTTRMDGRVTFKSLGRSLVFKITEPAFEPWVQEVNYNSHSIVDVGDIRLRRVRVP